ncbi:hypothetical protein GCM10022276_23860 [Sphingomonas limnosediminicola]|uniref:DUF4893 domain-containing protein n=1 Tax=Sphingomonas limnosediminicola TaxID=940133 RepID=A0ABP7LLU6_9SPHN
MPAIDTNVRTRVRLGTLIAVALLASGCETKPTRPPGVRPVVTVEPPAKSEAWKKLATAADQNRIARLDSAWQQALTEAGKSFTGEIRKEGALLKPQAALPRPAPTPGSYNCRLIKLGQAVPKTRAYESFKPFFCYVEVEGDLLTIVKQTGSQRPAGRLWEDDSSERLIFLGSLALGDEQMPVAYGDDPKRDMAGVLERIAPFKWRLVIPWPQSTSKLDVFELTPVAQQPQG